MQHYLTGMVRVGLQEQGVHIRMAGDAGCFGLNSLGATYLQSLGRGIAVECHVLCLEGRGTVAVL